jgi:hypothetical protein
MSGFKMGRKLRTLMVGILAFALANSLQSSLATNESSEDRQKCVAEFADQLAKIEVTGEVKVIMEKSREYYPDYVAFVNAGTPSDEYLSALAKLGSPDGCDKVLSDFGKITAPGCSERILSDNENDYTKFLSELLQVSQEVKDVLDADRACSFAVKINQDRQSS